MGTIHATQTKTSITTEVTYGHDLDFFHIDIDRKTVEIPVKKVVLVNFKNQFKSTTSDQKNRLKTLKNLVRAAYLAGLQHHAASTGRPK